MSNKERSTLGKEVASKAARKLKAQHRKKKTFWAGIGMFGLVGWSVAIPTLSGVGLGLWLDRHFPSTISWTLTLLLTGIVLGCINAWYWVNKENQSIYQELEDDDE